MDMSLPPPLRAAADGEALDALLARGRPSLARCLRIADGLALALAPLHDAHRLHGALAADPYLAREAPKSALCLPFARQGAPAGLLYLENRLAAQTFSDECAAVLELLASQAAIALDHARLVAALQQQGRGGPSVEPGAPHVRDQPAETPR
jgi:GAF domain-containing protein